MASAEGISKSKAFQVPTGRLVVAVLILIATQGVVMGVGAVLNPSTIRPPRQALKELPNVINGWIGTETEIDSRIVGNLGATDVIGRQYTKEGEGRASVHVANWTELSEWLPHPPEMCYVGAGWQMQNRISKKPFEGPNTVAEQQTYARDGQQVRVTYWYQLGQTTYYNRDGARPGRMQYLGQQARPPLYKVMIQTSDLDESAHTAAVKSLAVEIKNWIARQ